MSPRPELLFLAHRIPFPPDKGDKIRSFRLVEHLARRFAVHLCAFVDDRADFAHRGALERLCASVSLVPLASLAARARSAAGFFTGEALTFPYYRDAQMRRHVERARARGLAAEVAFSSSMAPYLEQPSGAPRFIDFCDSDAEKWRQYADETPGPMRALFSREARTLAAAETEILGWGEAAFAASAAEAAIFNARRPDDPSCRWFGNGVDAEFFRPSAERAAPDPAAEIVFVGRMDYRANIDAAVWFVREVWPKVRGKRDVRFAIVGAEPAKAVRALGRREGVIVTGRVGDVRPYLQHARAVVAPLRVARGVQNKVLEAMAMARPVVATTAAAEGIGARPGEELLLADAPEDFAAAILFLLADRQRGEAIGASARARMKADYGWPAQLARLDAAMAEFGL